MMYDYFYGIQAEQFSFYRIPKLLFTHPSFKGMSTEAKTLYGNNWIDEEGRVYIIFNDNILALFSADERQD